MSTPMLRTARRVNKDGDLIEEVLEIWVPYDGVDIYVPGNPEGRAGDWERIPIVIIEE